MEETLKLKLNNPNSDKVISIALVSSFVILTIQYLILIVFKLNDTSLGANIQTLSKVLVGLVYIIALPKVLNNGLKSFILTYIISVTIFSLSYLIYPNNRIFLDSLIFPIFFMSVPSFIYALNLKDYKIFLCILRKASYIVLFTGVIISFLVFAKVASIGYYSMALSYYMLLPAIIFLNHLLDRLNLKFLILSAISLIIIITLGARGPLLVIFVFTFFKILINSTNLNFKKILILLFFGSVFFLTYLYLDEILLMLKNILANYGINSRTITLFLEEGLSTSGRDEIYTKAFTELMKSPFFGYGVAGDRFIVGRSDYVHNIFLEFFLSFGFFIGLICLFSFVYKIIKDYFNSNNIIKVILLIFFSLGFVPLLVSGSFLIDIEFWIFIGILFSNKEYHLSTSNK